MFLLALQAMKARRINAATDIQRIVRGKFGRKRFRLFKKIDNVRKRERALEMREQIIFQGFKETGAAVLIQGWWRGRQARALTRAIVGVTKRRKGIVLQCWWRGRLAMMKLKRLKAADLAQREKESNAALALQSIFRISQAVKKLKGKKKAVKDKLERRRAFKESNMVEKHRKLFGRDINVTKMRRRFHMFLY